MNLKRFIATLLGVLSSATIFCAQLQNQGSECSTFIQDVAAIIFTTAAPIMVQFGGYGYLIAVICCLIGVLIELCIIRKMLRLPFKFLAIRLLVAHAIALTAQLIVGVFILCIIALVVMFMLDSSVKSNSLALLLTPWGLLSVTVAIVLFVVVTNMIVQYYVFCWCNKEAQCLAVRKAVVYANIISYLLLLGLLVTVNHFTTIFKDARVSCKKVKQ